MGAERAQAAAAKPRKRVTARSTPEEIEALRTAVIRNQADWQDETRRRYQAALTSREQRFCEDLNRLFVEASWMRQTGSFPNGKCYDEQWPLFVEIWGLFWSAMDRRANAIGGADDEEGADPSSGNPEEE